jgi:hypothetical protein
MIQLPSLLIVFQPWQRNFNLLKKCQNECLKNLYQYLLGKKDVESEGRDGKFFITNRGAGSPWKRVRAPTASNPCMSYRRRILSRLGGIRQGLHRSRFGERSVSTEHPLTGARDVP